MDPLTLRALAHVMLAGGWCPIELPARAKWPPPEGRTGYLGVDMTADEVEAAAWTGNIATRMPAIVIGLDVDAYKGGLDTLKGLIERLGALPPTWIIHSGRNDGSGIRLYLVPAGMAWIAGLPGIEVIQRGHRYAVAPPSVHPDHGGTYAVWSQLDDGPVDELPNVDDLPELPWAWIAELSRAQHGDVEGPSTAASALQVEDFVGKYVEGDAPGYLATIVAYFLDRTGIGFSRHDTMQHCLIWAMECARAGVVAAEAVIEQLGEVWQEAHPSDTRRAELHNPARVTEFEAMLRHAIGKVAGKSEAEMAKMHDELAGPRMNVPVAPSAPPYDQTTEQAEQAEPAPTTMFTQLRFMLMPDPFVVPVVEWHAEALLARPTHAELAGAEKTLKSYTGLCIDIGLAAGLPILGRFKVDEPQRVLLMVGEGGEMAWLRRVAAICTTYGIEPGDIHQQVRYCTELASVTSPRFLDSVRAELESFGPALVHLDPWYAYAGGQADSRQVTEVGASLSAVGDLCSTNGASLVINHHFNRQGNEGLRQITGAGHAEWVDSWLLVKHRAAAQPGTGQYQLRLDVGSRLWGGDAYDLDFLIEPMTGKVGWRIEVATTTDEGEGGDEGAVDAYFIEVKLAVQRAGRRARKALTRGAWLERVKGRASTKRAAFDELVNDGLIVVVTTVKSGSNSVSTYQLADP